MVGVVVFWAMKRTQKLARFSFSFLFYTACIIFLFAFVLLLYVREVSLTT